MEFMKTKIQIRAEGMGVRQKSIYAGYNPFYVQNQLYEAGYGTRSLWTGYNFEKIKNQIPSRLPLKGRWSIRQKFSLQDNIRHYKAKKTNQLIFSA